MHDKFTSNLALLPVSTGRCPLENVRLFPLVFFISCAKRVLQILLQLLHHARRGNAVLVEQLAQPQPGSSPLHFDRPYAASTWQQFDVLMRRWLQSYWRHPLYNATRFAYCVLLGVILGTVYLWKGGKR